MITTLVALAGGVLGLGSFAGIAIKVLGWFGVGFSGGGWVGQALGHLCVKLIDLVFWLLTGFLRILGAGFDHLGKDWRAVVTSLTFAWGAYLYGVSDLSWFTRSTEPPAVTASVSKSAPARRAPRRSVVHEAVTDLRDTIRNQLTP